MQHVNMVTTYNNEFANCLITQLLTIVPVVVFKWAISVDCELSPTSTM